MAQNIYSSLLSVIFGVFSMSSTSIDNFIVINNKENYEEYVLKNHYLHVIHFEADWLEQCRDVNEFLTQLSENSEIAPGVKFYHCLAEKVPDVAKEFDITVVPTVVIVRQNEMMAKITGVNQAAILEKIQELRKPYIKDVFVLDKKGQVIERIKQLISENPILLFMKGTKSEPRCGFSSKTIALLNSINIEYETFDILEDEDIRQELKIFSDWPTYPQLYVNGKLIGGFDIIREMHEADELVPTLKNVNDNQEYFD